ncbi:hypothetical protein [Mycobacterium lepromatosis]|uniref:hypothetical protein n=1 Tax=Mycobacterium lepromatosis TaxID=480418 RepID=UPI000A9B9748|nr:hypothetical protein [Mycobacterium lepromatosis]
MLSNLAFHVLSCDKISVSEVINPACEGVDAILFARHYLLFPLCAEGRSLIRLQKAAKRQLCIEAQCYGLVANRDAVAQTGLSAQNLGEARTPGPQGSLPAR